MKKTSFPLSEVYRLLEPGPVVRSPRPRRAGERHAHVVASDDGVHAAARWVACQQPELLVCQPQGIPECVINIPTVELAETVVACGNTSGRSVDKFNAFGLTPVPAACVKAPLIAECYASLECKVRDGNSSPNITSSSWRSSRHGLTRRGNGPGRYITRAKASSWWRAGRSICLRQNFTRRK